MLVKQIYMLFYVITRLQTKEQFSNVYFLSAHIFFDDAFDFRQDTKRTQVNKYVKRLVKSVEIASR